MSWVSQIIKSALEGDAVEMKTAFEKEMDERISDKMDDLYQEATDELFAESEELDESFKRGDIIEVPGADSTKHKAVMISPNKAVYIKDDSAESVPSNTLSKATKAKRTTRDEKSMASEYLKAMKEDLDENKQQKHDWKDIDKALVKANVPIPTIKKVLKELIKNVGDFDEYDWKDIDNAFVKANIPIPTIKKVLKELIKNEGEDLDEAKMSNAEVLAAAKRLAKNGKDAKTKSFGQGLVDFYDENDSFTPDQVAGLQNIMKNASFQMAKD